MLRLLAPSRLARHTHRSAVSLRSGMRWPDGTARLGRRYCSSSASEAVEPPTRAQLFRLAIASGVPFVGFGIADNGIMIIAGDQIDASLGVRFGLSTLAAAGLGAPHPRPRALAHHGTIRVARRLSLTPVSGKHAPPCEPRRHEMSLPLALARDKRGAVASCDAVGRPQAT